MKFACPESQKRVFLKCGSIDSGSTPALLGVPPGSSASGDGVPAVWLDVESVWDCARATGSAPPTAKARVMTSGSGRVRQAAAHARTKPSITKMKFNFNIMTSQRLTQAYHV